VFGKQLNPKAVASVKKKCRSLMRSFRLSLKDKRMSMMVFVLKILNIRNLIMVKSSMIRNCNRILFLHQCCFLHMDHQYLCHRDLISACFIFICHSIIIHICHLFLDILILHIEKQQLVNRHLCIMTISIKRIGPHKKINAR
jgi:hypothetical protein